MIIACIIPVMFNVYFKTTIEMYGQTSVHYGYTVANFSEYAKGVPGLTDPEQYDALITANYKCRSVPTEDFCHRCVTTTANPGYCGVCK